MLPVTLGIPYRVMYPVPLALCWNHARHGTPRYKLVKRLVQTGRQNVLAATVHCYKISTKRSDG